MHLIVILLTTVAILTFLSGAIVFFGSSRSERVRSAWFFLAAIFATTWMASLSCFLIADQSWSNTIDWHVKWTFTSAVLIDVFFLAYVAWRRRHGHILSYLFGVFGGLISFCILLFPRLLFNGVNLSRTGNSINMNIGPLYFAYIAYFCLVVPAIVLMLVKRFMESRSKKRNGSLVVGVSFGISSTLILITNLIMPLFGYWSAAWVGALAFSTTILAFYYTILRYRSLNLSSIWLRIFSYVVIIASIAIIYMLIFSIIFAILFRGSAPSIEVIVLNFIMIMIFISLMPAMNGFLKFVHSIISSDRKV